MPFTIREIAEALNAKALGDLAIEIERPAEPADAGPNDLALAMKPEFAEGLAKGSARAAVVWDGADWQNMGLKAAIIAPRSRYAMAHLTRLIDKGPISPPGVHETAIIDSSAKVGSGASIGPFTVIGPGVRIGDNARIGAHVSIAYGTEIGDEPLIHDGVRIGHEVRIGARVILLQNCVIGSDGFSFVTPEKSGVERARESLGDQGEITAQSWTRIHSLGGVEISDDVEVGAISAIDRGTIRATTIGRGTKIDNIVHIAHNVVVGEDCLLCAQVGIAGSTRIGNRVVLGGQVGVGDNIFIGDDVVAGGSTIILTNAPAGRVLLGYPAMKMDQQISVTKHLRRLPRLAEDVKALQKAVSKLLDND